MSKLLNFRFPEGWYFLNCDNTEVETSIIFFFCLRTASLGGWGLINYCLELRSKFKSLHTLPLGLNSGTAVVEAGN